MNNVFGMIYIYIIIINNNYSPTLSETDYKPIIYIYQSYINFNLTTLNKTGMSQNYVEAKHGKVQCVFDNYTARVL